MSERTYRWKYDGLQKLLRNLGLEMIDLGFFDTSSKPEERSAPHLTLS